jgi:hypothetical protein
MMKLKLSAAVLLLGLPLLSYADGCTLDSGGAQNNNVFSGATTCTKATLDKISVNGQLTLKDSTIATVVANGAVNITQSTIAKLVANGPMNLNDAKIDKLILKGALESVNSNIANITITGGLNLKDSKAGDIIINHTSMLPGGDKIYLKGNTVVNGNITFTNENGTVYQEKDVKLNGKVIGGKVEQLLLS